MFDPRPSLYLRLGGYDALAAFVDDLLSLAASDPQIAVYLKGMSRDSRRHGRQLTLDFLCSSLGGPAIYLGRDMKTLHEGMGISNDDWSVLMGYAGTALDNLGVAQREKSDTLAFLEGLKGDIVETHGAEASGAHVL
jgi:hemoglobin